MTTASLFVFAAMWWTPYNHGVTPCPTVRVQFVNQAPATMGVPAGYRAIAYAPLQRGACRVKIVRREWAGLTRVEKYSVAVHELGHSGMGLDHSPDRTNVMYFSLTTVQCSKWVEKWCNAG